ncbi:MAG: ribosome-recycling factor [bacterium]|nr:ribosome-recycling factor [bacterium]
MELKTFEQKLKIVTDALKQELAGLRTNRPTSKLVEDIEVNYMEQILTIKQLGAISVVPPREIDISIWDKGALASVVSAIEKSNLGLNPNTSGNLIRINLPPLTDERRKDLEKIVRSSVEQARIKIRGLRDEVNKAVEQEFKSKTINEDQKFKSKKQIQDSVDKINQEIEKMLEGKSKEINE